MTGTTALTVGIVAVEFGQNIWVAIGVSLVLALAIGFFNGWLVTRTGLPSFIITLGTFLMLQGLNLGLTKLFTGTVTVGGIDDVPGYAAAEWVFASRLSIAGHRVPRRDPVVGAVHRAGHLGAAAHPVRQLGLRHRRGRRRGAQRRACRPGAPRSPCS